MRYPATLCLFLLLTLLGGSPLAAQVGSTTDIIRGQVTGPAGEAMPGVTVTAISVETGVRRTATTNAQGPLHDCIP